MRNFAEYFTGVVNSCMSYSAVKWLSGSLYSAYIFAFGGDAKTAIFSIGALVIIDAVTGIYAAKKAGEVISSPRAFGSVVKCLVYLLMISAAHLFEVAVPILGTSATSIIIAFLALTEVISVMENIAKMGYEVPLKLLNTLQGLKKDR